MCKQAEQQKLSQWKIEELEAKRRVSEWRKMVKTDPRLQLRTSK